MPYTPILATLGYIISPDRKNTLLIHRNSRPNDQHFGKYNGLGGKLESNEDVIAGLKREIYEEAGLTCEQIVLRGTISWPGFGANGENWFAFVFRIDSYKGTPFTQNPEGSLAWVPIDQILTLPLWEGDRYFLPMVFDDTIGQFHGVMPYSGGTPLGWSYSLL